MLRLFGSSISSSALIAENVYIGSPLLSLGEGTHVNVGCFLDGSAAITLAEGVRLGPYCKILTGTHTYANGVLRRGKGSIDINKSVTIERGCWAGMGVIVLPGVVLSEGCVIAAGAVVVDSTLPNGLYAGIPARRIKDLPTE